MGLETELKRPVDTRKRSPSRAIFFLLLVLAGSAHAAGPAWLGGTYDTVLSEEWMNVLFNGKKIGFSYNRIEKGDKGYRITGRAVMRLSIMGMTQDMSFSQTFYLDAGKNVLGFISLKNMGSQRMQTVGSVHGDRIELAVTGAGGTNRSEVRIKPGTRFLEALGFQMADELSVGMKKSFPVYIIELRASDTITMEVVGRKTVETGGEKKEAFVVDFRLQGFTTRSYVTPDGVTVREEEGMLGITSRRVTEAEALAFPSGAVPVTSLITFSLVKPDRPIRKDPATLRKLRIMIGGLDDPSALPSDERQLKESAVWREDASGRRRLYIPLVTLKTPPPEKTLTISEASRAEPGSLNPTPEAQSDNKMIIREARRIIGGEKNSWKAAQRINRWVYDNVEKDLVDSFSAVDVLLSRKGECQSHTNLFTALARSVGIPTRTAAGLVYSATSEGFLYHAWPEVYVGRWVAVDPTMGQDVADVTHIKLSEGELEDQIKLVRFIGRISVLIVSSE